jgi:hypothetical protein
MKVKRADYKIGGSYYEKYEKSTCCNSSSSHDSNNDADGCICG